MDVSIIIVNYNTKDITSKCIESIFRHTTNIDFEIIVVDNASTDNSADKFSSDQRITFIHNKTNLGFGKANNIGYQQSKGKYIFLLNSDTILLNNAVKIFYDKMQSAPQNIACLGCILKDIDEKTATNSYSTFPSITSTLVFLAQYYLRISSEKKQKDTYPVEVDYIIGADLFIRRSVIELLGLFDPDFFMYYEDSEMQLRYNKAGYKSIVINEPQIIHLEGASYGEKKLTGKKAEIYFQGMFIYMRKRYTGIKYIFFRIISILFIPLFIRNKTPLLIKTLLKRKLHYN